MEFISSDTSSRVLLTSLRDINWQHGNLSELLLRVCLRVRQFIPVSFEASMPRQFFFLPSGLLDSMEWLKCGDHAAKVSGTSDRARVFLLQYDWPGVLSCL